VSARPGTRQVSNGTGAQTHHPVTGKDERPPRGMPNAPRDGARQAGMLSP